MRTHLLERGLGDVSGKRKSCCDCEEFGRGEFECGILVPRSRHVSRENMSREADPKKANWRRVGIFRELRVYRTAQHYTFESASRWNDRKVKMQSKSLSDAISKDLVRVLWWTSGQMRPCLRTNVQCLSIAK